MNADLKNSLAFVIERIGEEAVRSGVPLDEDEIHLLKHLPTGPTNPTASWGLNAADEISWPTPILRDFQFERLCKLAKDAHHHDIHARHDAAREWRFAGGVLKLHQHPLAWLLQWAHIRTPQRPGLWDFLLLAGTAILVVTVFILGVLALSVLTEGQKDLWNWTLWIAGGCTYGALLTFFYFGVKRIESRQQKKHVEKYRCNLPVRSPAARTVSSSKSEG